MKVQAEIATHRQLAKLACFFDLYEVAKVYPEIHNVRIHYRQFEPKIPSSIFRVEGLGLLEVRQRLRSDIKGKEPFELAWLEPIPVIGATKQPKKLDPRYVGQLVTNGALQSW